MSNEPYQIHNDVLLTDSGVAFLIEGNHSVLNYITEKSKPTEESFENFKKNIANRAYISHLCKAKYLHVIFPDKQSVMHEAFPIKGTIRLGDKYLEKFNDSPLKGLVNYPADLLKKYKDPFQPLDTHLSDFGTLVVLQSILHKIGEPADQVTAELSTLIDQEINNNGDLGLKFSPPRFQKIKTLRTNWNYRSFTSNGTHNNGQIDILINPDAYTNKKVLIFGDSFFRLMLTHLSRVFREVVFLRTPYFHVEMVELIKPDIIFSGNSERYLANVSSDFNAPAFQMYAYTHNSTRKPSQLFINAFRAITSPNAQSSKNYFAKIFHSASQPMKLVGPSHIVRWGQHLKNKVLNTPVPHSHLIGYGGAPVWSKRLLDTAEKDLTPETKVLLMVGDFRFGNEICLQPSYQKLPLFSSNFSGISSKAINPENDKYMYERCKSALKTWNTRLGNQVIFIFWDLFCRQVQDRLSGKYIGNKKYEHPHWNLVPTQGVVPESSVLNLSPLLNLPMHEAVRLFIDGSSHPSQIGYLTITNMFIHGSEALCAYNKAVYDVEKSLLSSAQSLVSRKNKSVAFFGRSVWIDTLVRYLGPSGIEKLESKGVFLAPINGQVGHKYVADIKKLDPAKTTFIYISENGLISDLPVDFTQPILETGWQPTKSTCIAWEASCASIISSRNETPRALHGQLQENASQSNQIPLVDADVELGPYGYPSINGILKLMDNL